MTTLAVLRRLPPASALWAPLPSFVRRLPLRLRLFRRPVVVPGAIILNT